MIEDWQERLSTWVRRKVCQHDALTDTNEIRRADGPSVYWARVNECKACGEILGVEAEFHGEPRILLEVIEKEVETR